MEFSLTGEAASKAPRHRPLPNPQAWVEQLVEFIETLSKPPSQPEHPYTPIDPTSALLGPLALLALAYGRKKSRGKWDTLVILLVLGLSLGLGLAACEPGTYNYETETATAIATVTPSPTETATVAITVTPKSPVATDTPSPTVTMTCTLTLTPENTPTSPVPTPVNEKKFYDIYNVLMDPQYKDKWWRTMDDGAEMIMAVMSYLEFRTIKDDLYFIKAVTDALSNRYRYVCPAGCLVENGILSGEFRWIMRWSHSLMKLENGMTRDLDASSIDESFAKSMGESIIRDNNPHDYDRPWGAFNPQTDKEFDYFRGKHKFNGDTNYDGVYWWSPKGASSPPVAIVLTHRQDREHCSSNNPEYGADKGITCGN